MIRAEFIRDGVGNIGPRFRIIGPCEAADWAKDHARRHPDEDATCEISVSADGRWLSSYGGKVWPGAWPSLFRHVRPTVQNGGGGYEVTAAGMALLGRALPHEHPMLAILVDRAMDSAFDAVGAERPSKATP